MGALDETQGIWYLSDKHFSKECLNVYKACCIVANQQCDWNNCVENKKDQLCLSFAMYDQSLSSMWKKQLLS